MADTIHRLIEAAETAAHVYGHDSDPESRRCMCAACRLRRAAREARAEIEGGVTMTSAPTQIHLAGGFRGIEHGGVEWGIPPSTRPGDPLYIRADACLHGEALAEVRDSLAACIAMIQHAIGPGKDVFIEPDVRRRLSDARAALSKMEARHAAE